jgi:hypothetical protein
MKHVLIVLAVLTVTNPANAGPFEERLRSLAVGVTPVQGYTCANVSCKRLRSCEEACYKLKVCGQKVRDRDNDGIPCENLCSRRCP